MRVSNSFCRHREGNGSPAGYNRAPCAFEIDAIIETLQMSTFNIGQGCMTNGGTHRAAVTEIMIYS
jgi:hypothetical protein